MNAKNVRELKLESLEMHGTITPSRPESTLGPVLQKLVDHAWHELSDSELLTPFMLRLPTNHLNALSLADEILSRYGCFGGLLSTPPEIIEQDYGHDEDIAAVLLALRHLAHRVAAVRISGAISLDSLDSLNSYVKIQKLTRAHRCLSILYLDQDNQLIGDEHISGNIVQPDVCRAIVKKSLSLEAKNLIAVDYRPMQREKLPRDFRMSLEKLKDILNLIGVELHDYILAYEEKPQNLAKQGSFL